jgi:MFS family permease
MKISLTGKSDKAIRFVILLGLVSLFSDMTYEAARSINGPFLQILGASGTTVGWIAGLGELIGYGLRFLSGYLADKTKRYWLISICGYLINLLAVPLMAFAGYWQFAMVLMILERTGKAVRSPARDALLSFGTKKLGRGWGYGLHEAMDQIGATAGPFLVSAVLLFKNQDYHLAYAVLLFPAILAIGILLYGRYLYPYPENLEVKSKSVATKGFPRRYWIYVLSAVFIALGYADFPLIAFHAKSNGLMSDFYIPLCYALAMFTDAWAALILGRWFDKRGIVALMAAILISSLFAPMVFLGGTGWLIAGMVVWGIGMGAQESILKAEIAEMIPAEKRGAAFGTFHASFGLFWFAGSALMGYLYDVSIIALVILSAAAQLTASGVLLYLIRRKQTPVGTP